MNERLRPDVVVLNARVPGESDIGALRRIKAKPGGFLSISLRFSEGAAYRRNFVRSKRIRRDRDRTIGVL
jgi:hypothetical protein